MCLKVVQGPIWGGEAVGYWERNCDVSLLGQLEVHGVPRVLGGGSVPRKPPWEMNLCPEPPGRGGAAAWEHSESCSVLLPSCSTVAFCLCQLWCFPMKAILEITLKQTNKKSRQQKLHFIKTISY